MKMYVQIGTINYNLHSCKIYQNQLKLPEK